MPRLGPNPRRLIPIASLMACALLLQACSFDTDPDPTPTPAPTPVVFGPDDVAVGDLIDESRDAWTAVDAWSTRMLIDAADSDNASATSSSTIERVILPGDRYVQTMNGDTVVTEEIVVDGTISMRGTLVSSSIYPEVDAETWITFTPDQVPAGSVLEQRVDYLTAPLAYPFDTVTDETRALPAHPAGEIEVEERTCNAYDFSTAQDGSDGITYRIAFDDEQRPCQLVRTAGGVIETTTWTYPENPEPIENPAGAVQVVEFPTSPG